MIIRFHRTIPRSQLLEELTKEHGSTAALEKKAKKNPNKRAILEEWRFHLKGDPKEPVKLGQVIIFHDPKAFVKQWTPQRLALYEHLKRHRDVESLNQLAKQLGRNYRNVHADARLLAKTGVISLERHANHLVPRAVADEVTVTV